MNAGRTTIQSPTTHGGAARTARLGVVFFIAYTMLYAAFVGVAAFGTFTGGAASGGLAARSFGDLPWGVVAGFALILGAFVLALLYAYLARGGDDA